MAIYQRDYYERSAQPLRSTLTSCNAGPTCCQPSSVPTSGWDRDERGSRVDPPQSRNVSFAKDALARDAERSYYASRYGESASAVDPKDSDIRDRPSARANSNYPAQQGYNQPQSRVSQIPNDYGVPVNTVPEAYTNGRSFSGVRNSSAHQGRDSMTDWSFARASRLNNYAVQQEFQASQAPDDYGVPVTASNRQADDRSFARANNYSVQQESKASTASHIPNDYGVPVTAPYDLTNDRRFSRARKIFTQENPQRTHTSCNVDMSAGAFQNQAGEARGDFRSADQSQIHSNYPSDPFTGQQGSTQSEVDYWRQKSIESDAIIQSLQKQNARLRDDRDELEADVNRSVEERISWEIAYKQLYAAKMGKEAEVRALRKLSEDTAMADVDDDEDSLNFRRIQGRYRPVFYGKYY